MTERINNLREVCDEMDVDATIDDDHVTITNLHDTNGMVLAEFLAYAYDAGYMHNSFMSAFDDNGCIVMAQGGDN